MVPRNAERIPFIVCWVEGFSSLLTTFTIYFSARFKSTSCIVFLLYRSGLFFQAGYNSFGHQKETKVEKGWNKLSPILPARIPAPSLRNISLKIAKSKSLDQFMIQTKKRRKQYRVSVHSMAIPVSFSPRHKPFDVFSHPSTVSKPASKRLYQIRRQHRSHNHCAPSYSSKYSAYQRQNY